MKSDISKTLTSRLRPERFFLVAALILEIFYSIITPPMQSPDELNHFSRAWQISEGGFLAEKKDQRVGGSLPQCITEFALPFLIVSNNPEYRLRWESLRSAFAVKVNADNHEFRDFPNTANYSVVSYLPQVMVMYVLREAGCSMGCIWLGGKLAIFLAWLISIYFAIRILPFGKWLFVALMLLPMQIYQSGSYTADTVTNILSILLIAIVLRAAAGKARVSRRVLLAVFLSGALLALAKVVYAFLLLLLLAIPAANYGTRTRKYLIATIVLGSALFIAVLWSRVVFEYYIPYSEYAPEFRDHSTILPGADYHLQKQHLVTNKLFIFRVLFNGLIDSSGFFLRTYIGEFGTFLGAMLPPWAIAGCYLLLLLLAFFDTSSMKLFLWQKAILLVSALTVFAMLVVSQHLIWNPVGHDTFLPLQGRYLVPVMPLMFLLFLRKGAGYGAVPVLIVFVFLLLSHGAAADALYQRYRKPLFTPGVVFDSGFERQRGDTCFATSDPGICLGGTGLAGGKDARGGKHSLLVPPGKSGAHFLFSDFRVGDEAEIDVWMKGNGGRIILESRDDDCTFQLPNNHVLFSDGKGWGRLNMTFTMFIGCESRSVEFYLENSGEDTIFFDELSFRLWRLPRKQGI